MVEASGEAGWDSLTSTAMLITIATGPEVRSLLSPGGVVTGCTYEGLATQAVWNVFAGSTPAVLLRAFRCDAARPAPQDSCDGSQWGRWLRQSNEQCHVRIYRYRTGSTFSPITRRPCHRLNIRGCSNSGSLECLRLEYLSSSALGVLVLPLGLVLEEASGEAG